MLPEWRPERISERRSKGVLLASWMTSRMASWMTSNRVTLWEVPQILKEVLLESDINVSKLSFDWEYTKEYHNEYINFCFSKHKNNIFVKRLFISQGSHLGTFRGTLWKSPSIWRSSLWSEVENSYYPSFRYVSRIPHFCDIDEGVPLKEGKSRTAPQNGQNRCFEFI